MGGALQKTGTNHVGEYNVAAAGFMVTITHSILHFEASCKRL